MMVGIISVTSGGAQTSEYPSAATFSTFTNSIIGIALNLDDNNFIFYKDGTAMNPSGTAISITAGTYIPAVSIYGTNVSYNFGSPPYSISSGNSDANGHGNFEYAVPSGYFALCTKKFSGVWIMNQHNQIGIMAYTTIDNPELYFQTKTYTGTGSSHAITLDGSENMQPDWVWIKEETLLVEI